MNTSTSISNNDTLLLEQVKKGNISAFNCLYEKYHAQVYSNAFLRLRNVDQTKDIVQDIFINIWMRRGNSINNLPAYLNIAVRNQVYKLLSKQKNLVPFFEISENVESKNQNTDSNILWQEFYQTYESFLTTLPPKRQTIFRLHYHDDLTTKAIADKMDISRKTVQNQLGKAVKQLRIILPLF